MRKIIKRRLQGLSLVEVMFSTAIVSIAILGGITYRYYSTLDGRRAILQSTAARAAQLLCESWHGEGGDINYNPFESLTTDSFIINAGFGPDAPNGFTLFGKYQIEYNGVKCYATLSSKDIYPRLRALSVIVAWASRDKAGDKLSDMDRQFALTNYVTW